MDLIESGIKKGLISFDEERKYITYVRQKKKRNYTNPEEQVQAETFLKLILVYGYPVEHIQQFVTVTMGSSTKEADILVYNDDDCSEPHIIVECKKPEVSELEFEQAIEQGFAYCYATAKTVKFLWVTSGIKDRYFEVNKEKQDRFEAQRLSIEADKVLEDARAEIEKMILSNYDWSDYLTDCATGIVFSESTF